MATFSINQVRHFYVADTNHPVEVKSGNGTVRFVYTSPGGTEGSDIIDVDKVLYATYTKAEDMEITLKKSTVTIPVTGLSANEVYAVKVFFTNYAGAGDDNITVKYGEAYLTEAEKNDQEPNKTLANKLVDSLKKNLKDLMPLADVSDPVKVGSTTDYAFSITQAEDQPYEVGVKPFAPMPFIVEILPANGDSLEWASVENNQDSAIKVSNAKKIADMEWFYAGARGDMYRGFGHPYGVKTKLVANPELADGYNTIDIHYAYVGPNEGAQKSEKTITIAGTSLSSVITALESAGITVDNKPA